MVQITQGKKDGIDSTMDVGTYTFTEEQIIKKSDGTHSTKYRKYSGTKSTRGVWDTFTEEWWYTLLFPVILTQIAVHMDL